MKMHNPLLAFICLIILIIPIDIKAQHESAIMELESTTQGFLMPRMTTAQREAIVDPATGLQVYDLDTKSIWYYDDNWRSLISTPKIIEGVSAPNRFFPPNFMDTISLISDDLIGSETVIEVCVNILHPYNADVELYLIAPDGLTIIELSTDNGGGGDNYTNTCFSNEASMSILNGISPFTGRFLPEGDFSLLQGQPISGYWTLDVQDDVPNFDDGTLIDWSIKFITQTTDFDLFVNGDVRANNFYGDGSGLTNLNVNDADADPQNEWQDLSSVLAIGNSAAGLRILNIGNPIDDNDVVNKQYVDVEDETEVTVFGTHWDNYNRGFKTVRYYKDNDRVYITGLIEKSQAIVDSDVLFTLPAGYRPSAQIIGTGKQQNNTVRVDVRTDGQVVVVAGYNNTYKWISLAGISFTIN